MGSYAVRQRVTRALIETASVDLVWSEPSGSAVQFNRTANWQTDFKWNTKIYNVS